MKIAGIVKNSFVDYPGKIAAVLFTSGCNMNCFYCHNKKLTYEISSEESIDNRDILDFLYNRKKLLDGVVISGGEPTLQRGLDEFLFKVREIGYDIKLDTNGTNPLVIKELANRGLLNYIAMDIKAPFEKYQEICGVSADVVKIEESIDFIMDSGIKYEFRTTFVPQLLEKDILCIGERIKGAELYALQKFRGNFEGINPIDYSVLQKQHDNHYIQKTAEKLKNILGHIEIRGCNDVKGSISLQAV